MRKRPTYDWDWFESHTPFKKILEETCGLEIELENIPYQVFGNIWSTRKHYNIKCSYQMWQDNFENIKKQILNTRVCKHNKEIFDSVNEMDCSKKSISDLILDGCISNVSGSFKWDWCEQSN
jgi:hypothetical protein